MTHHYKGNTIEEENGEIILNGIVSHFTSVAAIKRYIDDKMKQPQLKKKRNYLDNDNHN